MSVPNVFDYETWENRLAGLKESYRSADPFPSIVLDNFLNSAALDEALSGFPDPSSDQWTQYRHFNEKKQARTKRELIPAAPLRVIDELNSPRFVRFLGELTGISGMVPDPGLEGGGLHQSKTGGFLNIHADFTSHPYHKNWARRVNVLIYLNKDWLDSYGGHLQLWDRQAQSCVKKILPVFNRCVVFSTDPDSFHGHPEPLTCPATATRKSIALYYFTEEKEPVFTRSTEYRAKPSDSLKTKTLVFADKMMLRGFDFLKRRLGISNDAAAAVLRRIFK
jgi:Rps23 Pro-64 3,4-dihydroxylase Tpa1-like proline 4-hydroxylase